jgi:hypothetical protein
MIKLLLVVVVSLSMLFLISCGGDTGSSYTCKRAAQNVWNVMGSGSFDDSCGEDEAACIEDMRQDCSGEDESYSYGAWTQNQINCISMGQDQDTICDCGTGTETNSRFCPRL